MNQKPNSQVIVSAKICRPFKTLKVYYPRWGYRRAISINDPCQSIFVNGPFSNNLYEITPTSDGVFVASGGIDAKYTYVYRADGVLSYKNKQWDVMNGGNVPVFSQNDIRDILRVVEHPDGNKLYFASFGAGVIEYDKETRSSYW